MTFKLIEPIQFKTEMPDTSYQKELFNVLFSKEVQTFSKEQSALHRSNQQRDTINASTGQETDCLLLRVPYSEKQENRQSRSIALSSDAFIAIFENSVHYRKIDTTVGEQLYETDTLESPISVAMMGSSKLLIGDLVGGIKQFDIEAKKVATAYSATIPSEVFVIAGDKTAIFSGYSDGSLARYDTRGMRSFTVVQENAAPVQELYHREQELFVRDEEGLIKLFDLRKMYDPITVHRAPENKSWSAFTPCREYQSSFLATVNDNENESTLYRVNKTTGAITPLQKINDRVSSLYYDFKKNLLFSHHNTNEKAIVYWEFEKRKEQFKEKFFGALSRSDYDEEFQTYTNSDKTLHAFLSKGIREFEVVQIEHPKIKPSSKETFFTIR